MRDVGHQCTLDELVVVLYADGHRGVCVGNGLVVDGVDGYQVVALLENVLAAGVEGEAGDVEFAGFLRNTRQAHEAVTLVLSLLRARRGRLDDLVNLLPLFQGGEDGVDALVLDCAFVSAAGRLRNQVAGDGHLLHAADLQRVAVGQHQLHAATVRGDHGFALAQYVADAQRAQFAVRVARIGLAADTRNRCRYFISHCRNPYARYPYFPEQRYYAGRGGETLYFCAGSPRV
ncbi:MAG: hypothetical protein CME59_09015 [Halioglobus sp.]|nr:hypothetical protein [Halioglobus sp.]